MKQYSKKVTVVLTVIYLLLLVWILIFKLGVNFSYMEERRVNLNPFNELLSDRMDTLGNILNILILVPLGFYVGLLFEKYSLAKKLLIVFLFTLTIECAQYIFKIGAFDAADLLTNTLGGLIGIVLFALIIKILTRNTINIVAALGTILIVTLLVLLKMDQLPIMYK